MSRFSFLLCNFNHGPVLARALDAIVIEAASTDQVVIVDDGSSDGSLSIMQRYVEGRPNWQVIALPENQGLMAASSVALAAADGDYVCLLAADDHLLPGMRARSQAALDTYPGVGIVAHGCVVVAPDQSIREYRFGLLSGMRYLSPRALQWSGWFRYCWLPTSGAFYRRDALMAMGGWIARLDWMADWFAAYALALRKGAVCVAEEGSIVFEDVNSFGKSGLSNDLRRRAAFSAFIDLLGSDCFADLRAGFSNLPIPLLDALGSDFADFLNEKDSAGGMRRNIAIGRIVRRPFGKIERLLNGAKFRTGFSSSSGKLGRNRR
jgi:glycosyltransferase involved in cell wall biosynthesis